jgi:hypothetical protein
LTLIIATKLDNGDILMMGDSFIGNGCHHQCTSKIYQIGSLGFGECGNIRPGNAILNFLRQHKKKLSAKWLEKSMGAKLRLHLEKEKAIGEDGLGGSKYIFAIDGEIFIMEGDLGVWKSRLPFAAIGAGEVPALGAFHAMDGMKLPAEEKALKAMQAASKVSSYVREPFDSMVIKGGNGK